MTIDLKDIWEREVVIKLILLSLRISGLTKRFKR